MMIDIIQNQWKAVDDLDREFQTHIYFVFNQCLQNIRKGGWTVGTMENCGKLLYRLYQVFCAYKQKKKTYTIQEWLGLVDGVGKELIHLFES